MLRLPIYGPGPCADRAFWDCSKPHLLASQDAKSCRIGVHNTMMFEHWQKAVQTRMECSAAISTKRGQSGEKERPCQMRTNVRSQQKQRRSRHTIQKTSVSTENHPCCFDRKTSLRLSFSFLILPPSHPGRTNRDLRSGLESGTQWLSEPDGLQLCPGLDSVPVWF